MARSRRSPLLVLVLACAPRPADDANEAGDELGESSTGEASTSESEASTGTGESEASTGTSETDAGETGTTGEPQTWRSALYPVDWTPEFGDADGHFLPDFSYAGYHNGELEPPLEVAGVVRSVLDEGADPTGSSDSTAAIQAAIDVVAAAGGGVVELPAGLYRCDGLLEVTSSGVVVRGEGPSSRIYFTRDDDMIGRDHLRFQGTVVRGGDIPLVVDAAMRSHVVEVVDDGTLALGLDVALGWVITDAFVDDHQMTGIWQAFNGQWRAFFRREIVGLACDGSTCTVELDVPVRYPALLRDQASLRVESGYLHEVGVEHLAVSTVSDEWDAAWANPLTHAIGFVGVADAWMRGVTSFESPQSVDDKGRELMSGGLYVGDAKRVTISDCTMARPQNRGEGGSGYLFEISRSNEVLTRDCVGLEGRHNFIQNWDFGTSGCVWLRVHTAGGQSFMDSSEAVAFPGYSDFHHSLPIANLVDACTIDDGWSSVNRTGYSSGAGHSGTQNVFWNASGTGTIRSFQYAWGYVIGTSGLTVRHLIEQGMNFESLFTAPEDWVEGLDAPTQLDPPSLYEDQLARRLGG